MINEWENDIGGVLFSEDDIKAMVDKVAGQISKDYAGKTVHLVCVLKGGTFFMCELAKRITVPVTMDFLAVSSYGDATTSSGMVKFIKDLDESVEGKDVIVVEDMLDSGRTLSYVAKILKERNPNSLSIISLKSSFRS